MSNTEQGSLSTDAMFVVQLRSGSDIARRQLSGRVEHIVSGNSEAFASLKALLHFMARYAATDAQPD